MDNLDKETLIECIRLVAQTQGMTLEEYKEVREKDRKPTTTVVNVGRPFLLKKGYDNLEEWLGMEDNVLICRRGRIFIWDQVDERGNKVKRYFPYPESIWANPYQVKKNSRETALAFYEDYIREKIAEDPVTYDLEKLRGKTLGCWCKPHGCHGDILCKLLSEFR